MPRAPPTLAFALALALALVGCTATGGDADPWAYTRQPLYAGGFDLAKVNGTTDSQQFRVSDGSIAAIRVQVWINATAGGATVTLRDPGGLVVLTTSETTQRDLSLNLGTWNVTVAGQPASAGIVHILATRA